MTVQSENERNTSLRSMAETPEPTHTLMGRKKVIRGDVNRR